MDRSKSYVNFDFVSNFESDRLVVADSLTTDSVVDISSDISSNTVVSLSTISSFSSSTFISSSNSSKSSSSVFVFVSCEGYNSHDNM